MFKQKIKKIGNSLCIIIPNNIVKQENLQENEERYFNISKDENDNVWRATYRKTLEILEDLQIIKEEIRNRTN